MWFIFLDPLPEVPKVGASRGPLFTISRGGEEEKRRGGEGEKSEEVHHPFQDIGSPTLVPPNYMYPTQPLQNLSHSYPT